MHWKTITFLVCLYGFAKEFRPIMPFLTPFLHGPTKNFTIEELYGDVFPYWAYSYLISSVPIFFLNDFLRYKPIVILEALMFTCTWSLFVWGTTVWQMTIAYLIYGVASASETAYYSYLYAVVDKEHYKTITSYTRTSSMLGQFVSYSGGQILHSVGWVSYTFLNNFSLGAEIIAFIVAMIIPAVKNVEHKSDDILKLSSDGTKGLISPDNSAQINDESAVTGNVANIGYFQKIRCSLPIILKNKVVITWSLWWILTSGLISQLYNYDQILWSTMQCDDHDVYNGIVAGIDTAGSAIIVFSLQYIHFDWETYGEIISSVTTLYFGCLYFAMAIVENIFIQYILYLLVVFCYVALITVAMTIITSQLNSGSFGLVFGFNTVTATMLQSLITFAVVDSRGLNLTVRGHFAVYSGCFMVLTIIFFTIFILNHIRQTKTKKFE